MIDSSRARALSLLDRDTRTFLLISEYVLCREVNQDWISSVALPLSSRRTHTNGTTAGGITGLLWPSPSSCSSHIWSCQSSLRQNAQRAKSWCSDAQKWQRLHSVKRRMKKLAKLLLIKETGLRTVA